MKKQLNLFAILLIATSLMAQEEYGTILDEDGYTNVRVGPSTHSKIKGRILEGEIFWIGGEEETKEWQLIFFMNRRKQQPSGTYQRLALDQRVESEGYIHKSRVQVLETIPITLKRVNRENSVHYFNDSIEVKIGAQAFKAENHTIQTQVTNSLANRIDGEFVWGTDGDLPTKMIAFIEIKINDQLIQVEDKWLIGLYQPNLSDAQLVFDQTTNSYLLTMANSDGAGYYEAIWQIRNGEIVQRYAFMPY